MSKQTISNQTITQYLLGSLQEAETDRLDELSFVDDEFAHALETAEKDLIDAYVQGELTGATLEQFRASYLSSPVRREKVVFAQAFQSFAEKNTAAHASAAVAEAQRKATMKPERWSWFRFPRFLSGPPSVLQWASVAAALVLLITGVWIVMDNIRVRQELSRTQSGRDTPGHREEELRQELERQRLHSTQTEQELARVRAERERLEQELAQAGSQRTRTPEKQAGSSIVAFILAPQMRDVAQVPVVSIPYATDEVEMQLRLEPNEYPAYRVSLLDQSGTQSLWRSGIAKARTTSSGNILGVRLRTELLKPHMYVLRVSGVPAKGAAEPLGDYRFKVVRQ